MDHWISFLLPVLRQMNFTMPGVWESDRSYRLPKPRPSKPHGCVDLALVLKTLVGARQVIVLPLYNYVIPNLKVVGCIETVWI